HPPHIRSFPTRRSSDLLSVLIGDVLYLKENIPGKVINIDVGERLARIAGAVSGDRLIRMSEFLGFIASSLKNHVNRQMLTDTLRSEEHTSELQSRFDLV